MKQAVLVMACRGPDGFAKVHNCKPLLWYYRSFIMAAAHKGRHLRDEEHVGSLMTLRGFRSEGWQIALDQFFDVVDELPLHYFTHFMHGAQILAYEHPDSFVCKRWLECYERCCDYLHMALENYESMDKRLSDFGRPLYQVIET